MSENNDTKLSDQSKKSGCGCLPIIIVIMIIFMWIGMNLEEKQNAPILSTEISATDKEILKSNYNQLTESQRLRFKQIENSYDDFSKKSKKEIKFNFNRLLDEKESYEENLISEKEALEKEIVEQRKKDTEEYIKNNKEKVKQENKIKKETLKEEKNKIKSEQKALNESKKIADKKNPSKKNWNINDYDGYKNGNVHIAGEVLSNNSIDEFLALDQGYVNTSHVLEEVWKYYGNVISVSGNIINMRSYSPDSKFAKSINNGGSIAEVIITTDDNVNILAYIANDISSFENGSYLNIHGLPVGFADLTNEFGGLHRGVMMVGIAE